MNIRNNVRAVQRWLFHRWRYGPKKPLPTDLEILDAIYERYYEQQAAYNLEPQSRSTRIIRDSQSRSAKIFMPIDIASVAAELGVDGDIVFGRLYYFLDPKFGFSEADGTKAPCFR